MEYELLSILNRYILAALSVAEQIVDLIPLNYATKATCSLNSSSNINDLFTHMFSIEQYLLSMTL